jgi:hypothetical protein
MHVGEQPGRPADHAVHEPHRGGRPGQRLQQRHDPVRGQEMHHYQVDSERGQAGAVPDRPGPRPVRSGGGVAAPAAALDPMLVVLGDGDRDLRDLVLLIAIDHAEITGATQVVAAVAAALREPVALLVGIIGPRQMRSRRSGLLAPRTPRSAPPPLLVRSWRLARIVVT